MPNDTPVSLSSDELAVISLGPRFIPVARDSLRASAWSEAIALFEHRIAVHLMFDGVPVGRLALGSCLGACLQVLVTGVCVRPLLYVAGGWLDALVHRQ